jgi:Raf kinase inhibitor-like YbhB/YbcL family protein
LIFFTKKNKNISMMQLTSPAFQEGQTIPSLYTCEGNNWNPPLEISHVPKAAVSLALIMDDPDVPSSVRSDRMWDHWVVFNIPPETRAIAENSPPPGILGSNTSGAQQYQGPCPPDREHRYFFKLYALKKMLTLPPGATKQQVESAMEGWIIEKAELMGRYDKRKGRSS